MTEAAATRAPPSAGHRSAPAIEAGAGRESAPAFLVASRAVGRRRAVQERRLAPRRRAMNLPAAEEEEAPAAAAVVAAERTLPQELAAAVEEAVAAEAEVERPPPRRQTQPAGRTCSCAGGSRQTTGGRSPSRHGQPSRTGWSQSSALAAVTARPAREQTWSWTVYCRSVYCSTAWNRERTVDAPWHWATAALATLSNRAGARSWWRGGVTRPAPCSRRWA